ncbi:hypothetical protein [Pseudosulfitobacter pseudonitzschiae]|uniref:Uncharacterized protein n=1 Tax=Pseudosulfitobacter pseudonitzschiae TaxID=1402135 RepID=A0A221K104_9RHOB|nr:hypothetical protein SULPSESMR1_01867 [Pseudosulfitobacter pseudonitzschiae]
MGDATFLYGNGAARSGTAWLAQALRAILQPQYDYVASRLGALPLRWQEHMQERAG